MPFREKNEHIFAETKCAGIIIFHGSLQSIVPMISGSQMQSQAPADSSSSSMSILKNGLSIGELEEVSIDYDHSDFHVHLESCSIENYKFVCYGGRRDT